MYSCFKCKIKPTFPLESKLMPLLSAHTAAAAVPPGQQELCGSAQGWLEKILNFSPHICTRRSGPYLPSCAQSVMLGCCVYTVISCYLPMRASSCASCQNSREIPAPVPSRPLLPSLEAEHTQAVENSTCPHKQDGTGSLPYLQGSVSKWGTGWSLQCSLGFSRSCPRHRGGCAAASLR